MSASASSGEDGSGEQAECPLCGEFEGEAGSVESHITASQDETHSGEKGEDHRERIREGTSTVESAVETAVGESGDSTTEMSSGGQEEADMWSDEEVPEADEEDGEGGGAGAWMLVVVVAIILLIGNDNGRNEIEMRAR